MAFMIFSLATSGCQKTEQVVMDDVSQNTESEISDQEAQNPEIAKQNDYIKTDDDNVTFYDPESGLGFSLPSKEVYLTTNETGEEADKTMSFRIQNYDPDGPEKFGLTQSEYYIELTVDYKEPSRMDSCQESLTSIETKESKGALIYMGYPDQGGDSGGERYAICFNGSGPDYYLQITDNNLEHPVRELIKESFSQK